jgi:hypothetical protein
MDLSANTVGQLVRQIESLRASGQTGFYILIVAAILLIVSLVVVVYLQRQSVNSIKQNLQATDQTIKSFFTLRN